MRITRTFRRYLRRSLQTTLVLLVGSGLVYAAQITEGTGHGELAGRVLDAFGAPIANATVTITDVDRSQVYVVVADRVGEYVRQDLPSGRYQVAADAPGFTSGISPPVAITMDGRNRVDVRLDVLPFTETVVVTGTPRSKGMSKLDASFAITTADHDRIRDTAPLSTADLLKISPGLWVESSGGESGANVMVRGFPTGGDAPFLTVQYAGSPIFGETSLSFLEQTTLFRIDETIDHVEILRGGPNSVLSNGQAGATANFVPRKGAAHHEGLVNLTGSSYGLKRIDMFYGGPLSDTWFVALGGFYRRSDGIRSTQFPADNGGQFSTSLRHTTTGGEIAFHVRATDDKNVWLLPIPLTVANGEFSSFPGFPAGTGTFAGNDTRFVNLEVNKGGGTVPRDLADGRGVKAAVVDGSLDQILGNGWTLGARVNYLPGHANTNGLVPNGLPLTLGELLAGVARPAAGGDAAGAATAVFAAAGTPVPLTQALENVGWWSVTKALKSFTADVRMSKAIGERATTTLGTYFADYSSDDLWYLNKNMLLTAETNGRRVDVSFANGVVFSRNGFAPSPWQDAVNNSNSAKRVAFFAAEEWNATDALRVDVGGRYEQYKVTGTAEGQACGADLDGDPKTLYDSNSCYLNGTHTTVAYPFTVGSDGQIVSDGYQGRYAFTAGVNYLLSSRNSVFVRFNNGFRFPNFDGVPPQNGTAAQPVQTVKQYELGYKVASRHVDADATFFGNRFEGLAFQQLGSAECPGPNGCPAVAGARAFGGELEAEMRPARGLRLGVTGTYTHSVFTDYDDRIGDDFTGNQVLRQPRWSGRVSAVYTFAWLSRQITPYTTWTSIGRRFSDNANLQLLPGYSKLDAGISCEIFRRTSLHVVGDNLTNVIGLTEGDPRATQNVLGNVALARPILGRSVQASIAYKF